MNTREDTYDEILALHFIESIKEEYLAFLYKTFEFFPCCCDISTQILFSYLYSKFQVGKIEAGYHHTIANFHSWGTINNKVIDFTFIQFLKDEDYIDEVCKKTESKYLYKEIIKKHYDSHILDVSYSKHFHSLDIIEPVFVKLANQSDYFTHYLESFNKDTLTELIFLNNDEFNKSKALNI